MASIFESPAQSAKAASLAPLFRLWRALTSNLLISFIFLIIALVFIHSFVTADSLKADTSLADLSHIHSSEVDHELDSDEYEYEDDDPEWVLDEASQPPLTNSAHTASIPARRTMSRQSSIVLITSTDPSTDLYHEPIQLEFADSPRGRALKGMPTAIRRVSSSLLGTPSPRDSILSSPVDGSLPDFGQQMTLSPVGHGHFPWSGTSSMSPAETASSSPLRTPAEVSPLVRPSLNSSICGSTSAPAGPPSILKREPEVFVSVIPSPTLPSVTSTPARSPNLDGAQSLYPASKGLFAPGSCSNEQGSIDDSRRSSLDSEQPSSAVITSPAASTSQWPVFALTGALARNGSWPKKRKLIKLMEPDWSPYVETHERARERQERADQLVRCSRSLPSTPIEPGVASQSVTLSPIDTTTGPFSASAIGDDEEFWFERTVQSTAASGRDWDWRKRRARARAAQILMEKARERALSQGMTEEAAQENMLDLPLSQRIKHRRREQSSPPVVAGQRSKSLPIPSPDTEGSGQRPQLTVDTTAALGCPSDGEVSRATQTTALAGQSSSADAYLEGESDGGPSTGLGLNVGTVNETELQKDPTKRALLYSHSASTTASVLRKGMNKMVGRRDDSPKGVDRSKGTPPSPSVPIPSAAAKETSRPRFPSLPADGSSPSPAAVPRYPRTRNASETSASALGLDSVEPSSPLQVPGRGSSLVPKRRQRSVNSMQTRRDDTDKLLKEADAFLDDGGDDPRANGADPADQVRVVVTKAEANGDVGDSSKSGVLTGDQRIGAMAGILPTTPTKVDGKRGIAASISSSNSSGSGEAAMAEPSSRGWRWRTSPIGSEKLSSRDHPSSSPSWLQADLMDSRQTESESTTSGSSSSITELRRRSKGPRPVSAQYSPNGRTEPPVQASPLSKSARRSTILKSADGALRHTSPSATTSPSSSRISSRSPMSTPKEPAQPQPAPSLQPEPAPVGMATRARSASISSQSSGSRLKVSRSPPTALVALPAYPSSNGSSSSKVPSYPHPASPASAPPPKDALPPIPTAQNKSRPASRDSVIITPTHSPRAVLV